jgi:hypothetical protein
VSAERRKMLGDKRIPKRVYLKQQKRKKRKVYDVVEEAWQIIQAEFTKEPCIFCETKTGKRCHICEFSVCDGHVVEIPYPGLRYKKYRCCVCDTFIRRTARG